MFFEVSSTEDGIMMTKLVGIPRRAYLPSNRKSKVTVDNKNLVLRFLEAHFFSNSSTSIS